jgi:SAM-dependent methyltransferase
MPLQFEPRFGQAAEAYDTYRPEYPAAVFQFIFSHVSPEHRHLAMDLGAGTGRATRNLVDHFEKVIAVEPDPRMAKKIRGFGPRVEVRVTTAEECVQQPESVDLIVIANALHWMEAPLVMKNVTRWLRPSGPFVLIDPPFPRTPEPIRGIVRQESHEHWETFRDWRLGNAGNRKERIWQNLILSTSGLSLIEEKTIASVIPMTPAEFVGFWQSTSYGSAYARSLGDPASYWQALESRFRGAWPQEKIPVDFSPAVLLAKKE